MKISLTLLESDSYIRDQILQALAKEVQPVLAKTITKITPKIQKLLEEALREEPEYSSLISGQLRLEFGIPDVSTIDTVVKKLAATANVVSNGVSVKSNGLSGGLTLTALERSSMGGLISNDNAIVITNKGQPLPWLQWLLYEGNKPIIRNYEVKIGPNPNSRTGNAIMVDSDKNWRVPPAFAGTINNNWVTRAVDRVSNSIPKIIQEAFESSI